jgi:NADH-quinone oxidoreductase subunit M
LQGAFRADWLAGAISAVVVIFAAWYLFWMFQRVMFGKTPAHIAKFRDLDWKESSSLVVLSVLSLLLGVLPGPVLEMIHPTTQSLLHVATTAAARLPEAAGFLGFLFK